jgi:hypothetical protein
MIRRRLIPGCALILGALTPALHPQAAPRPQPYCIRGVTLGRSGDKRATLLIRNGAIEALLDEAAPAPPGTRVIEGAGLLCLPAFLDAFARQGCAVPQPVQNQDLPPNEQADVGIDMRLANRKGIEPAFHAVERCPDQGGLGELAQSGFGALLVSPGEAAGGDQHPRHHAMRDVVLRDLVAYASFAASGPGYPSTLMGYFSQLRQFLRRPAPRRARTAHEQARGCIRPSTLSSRKAASSAPARSPVAKPSRGGHRPLDLPGQRVRPFDRHQRGPRGVAHR